MAMLYNNALIYGRLTNCGLVTAYGGLDLDQYWLRQLPVAWWRQGISWTNNEFSFVKFCAIPLKSNFQKIIQANFLYNEFENCTFKIIAPSSRG